MKSFLTGLIAILIIGLVTITIRNQNLIPTIDPSPSPTSAPSNWDMQPETSPDPTPTPSTTPIKGVNTTKGGLVLGNTTQPITTTTTTSTKKTTSITILKSQDCLLNATSYVRDLTSPLTIKYNLMNNYSATVTIWKESGESVLPQTLISGQGVLTTINSLDNLKFQINSQNCVETSDTWLSITATN